MGRRWGPSGGEAKKPAGTAGLLWGVPRGGGPGREWFKDGLKTCPTGSDGGGVGERGAMKEEGPQGTAGLLWASDRGGARLKDGLGIRPTLGRGLEATWGRR